MDERAASALGIARDAKPADDAWHIFVAWERTLAHAAEELVLAFDEDALVAANLAAPKAQARRVQLQAGLDHEGAALRLPGATEPILTIDKANVVAAARMNDSNLVLVDRITLPAGSTQAR